MTAGYSGTPLVKKLGIKRGDRLALLHAPENYHNLLGALPDDVAVDDELSGLNYDFVQAFFIWRVDYEAAFDQTEKPPSRRTAWSGYPGTRKRRRCRTDITEDVVRDVALTGGLVDVKVAAIDAQWSGLKLVYRKKDR